MADKKISELTAVTDVQDTDEFALARAGDNKKITGADLAAELGGGGGGLFDAYALLRQEEASGTGGGSSSSATWNVRTINTEVEDGKGIVSLSSNQFTLGSGRYLIVARGPSNVSGSADAPHKLRLRNVTDGTFVYGEGNYGYGGAETHTFLTVVVSIAASKTFEIQHYTTTGRASTGLGLPISSGQIEVYTNVEIFRFANAGSGSSGSSTSVTVAQTAHGLAVGDVIKRSGGAYAKAQADSAANAEVIGIVSAVPDANNFTYLTAGEIAGLSGLTDNTVYFLSPTTAGALTATEPTTAGQVSLPLLLSKGTTSGVFVNKRGAVIDSGGDRLFNAYALYQDQKAAGTEGGTFTSGSWQTRTLNTEVFDPAGIGSLASNQVTLSPGKYFLVAKAPVGRTGNVGPRSQLRIRDVTNGVTIGRGQASRPGSATGVVDDSGVDQACGRIVVTGTVAVEVQHRTDQTVSTSGLGWAANFDETEVYAELIIYREA